MGQLYTSFDGDGKFDGRLGDIGRSIQLESFDEVELVSDDVESLG